MRITQNSYYNRFIADQQNIKQELDDVNRQISSGMKIKYGYEDTQVFADTLRLDYEEHTLQEGIEVSSDAQTFANNTDSVMFQFQDSLDRFKTLLVQAANDGANGDANYFAISNEMKSLKDHMINLGNTSINGRYLFSGSAIDVKPLDENGDYHGNDRNINAIIGDQVEIPYNIPGSDLFLGEDKTFAKKVMTNVPLYKKVDTEKLTDADVIDKHPDQDLYIGGEDSIRELTGVEGENYFYIAGRRHDGTGFKTRIDLPDDASVDQLLEEIGKAYGNTSSVSMVDVSLVDGRIMIEDKQKGSSQLDFSMIASDKEVTDTKDLVEDSDAYVMLFDQGGRVPDYEVETLKSVQDPANAASFSLKSVFYDKTTQQPAFYTTKLDQVFPDSGTLTLDGTDVDGNSVSVSLDMASSTMKDLTDAIADNFGVEVSLGGDGRIEMVDASGNDGANFSLSMTTDLGEPAFRTEVLTESNEFARDGAYLRSDVSQIDKNSNAYAQPATKVVDVTSDVNLDNFDMQLNAVAYDTGNNLQDVEAHIYNDNGTMKLDVDGTVVTIKNADGSDTSPEEFTMQQYNDAVSLVMSGEYVNASGDYNAAVEAAQAKVHVALDDKGRIYVNDKTTTETPLKLAMFDSRATDYTTRNMMSFQSNNALTVDDPHHDLFDALDMAIEAVENGLQYPDGTQSNALARNVGIENAMARIDHVMEHVSKEHTRVGAISNRLSDAQERNETLKINVQMLRSDILDTDLGEASLRLNQLSINYQAMMATVAKVQQLSLVNYI
ncbi:MAG: hypothetical protein GXO33_08240 [Epsilonproteobacteria bacterium]|nr:hypothetical protein [Campylobacterota bacterium]